ncbi:hypothetical protein WI37_11645 [Burkholderia ubonensis]|nr:GNAT family N-acetyltransferase [Burkholderia ubonensis]KUZ78378.1 hypothetical protein WI37_11645 [Burkholderia ubonensis]
MPVEVRPDGLTAIDTFRLALANDLHAVRDDEPFAYFDAFWLKENAPAPHVAPRWRGPHRVAGRLPSVVHDLFLDDPRTEAVGCAVPAGQARVVDHLARHGFARQRRLTQAAAQPLRMRTLREAFFAGRHV